MQDTLIISRNNSLVKKIRKLRERKYREQYGEYIAEGKRWITDIMRICPQNVAAVICSEDAEYESADYVLEKSLFAELSDTENSQGIMALMRIPVCSDEFSGNYCLFLDRIRDPGNMGTIIRTANAAGFNDIVLCDCVDVYNPKVIRSSMTGVVGVNFHYLADFEFLKSLGYKIVAATLDGNNIFGRANNTNKICLVIGNEAQGIAENLLRECDERVTIPMRTDMESLNAAVSAGILMYELKFSKK